MSIITSCKKKYAEKEKSVIIQREKIPVITEQEVLDARKVWIDGLVKIGVKTLTEKGQETRAKERIIKKDSEKRLK